MTQHGHEARKTLTAWRADSVQAVAFVAPGVAQPDALAVWAALHSGESPDSFQRPSGAPNAVSTAAGPEGSAQLIVSCQIGRIDLVRSGRPVPEASAPPTLDSLDEAVSSAADQLKQLLKLVPVFRVAIVASLSVEVEGGTNNVLSEVADGVVFPDNASDCIYQLNVRRSLGEGGEVTVNRLCTWSSGEQSLIMFNIGGPGAQAPSVAPMTVKSIPIVNFNIDVNTATGPGFSITGDHASLIDGIANEVIDIANRGAKALQ